MHIHPWKNPISIDSDSFVLEWGLDENPTHNLMSFESSSFTGQQRYMNVMFVQVADIGAVAPCICCLCVLFSAPFCLTA